MIKYPSRQQNDNTKNFDNWTIDNNPEDSLRENSEQDI